MGVSGIMQLKFQQSFEYIIVPQILFVVRVLDMSAESTVPNCAGDSTGAGAGDRAERGPSSRQSTEAFGRISCPGFLGRAVRTGKYGALFPSCLVAGSHAFCVWGLRVGYRIEFFGRCCGYSGAMLGSTVDTCSASVLDAF